MMNGSPDGYYNLAERIADAFSEIDSDISTELLRSDSEYAALQQEADGIKQAHPLITELFEGAGPINLTADEHAAYVQYLDLKLQMEEAERRQIYFRGHTDCFAYLKRIGVILAG